MATVTLPLNEPLVIPVTSSPTAKVMDCAPAGRDADAVVHTMVRVAGVITHPDKAARPDTGLSVPCGVAGPVK